MFYNDLRRLTSIPAKTTSGRSDPGVLSPKVSGKPIEV